MTLLYSIFISCKSLYMFRVKHSPIIRSSIKLYLQHLVLTNRVWPVVVVDESEQDSNADHCYYTAGYTLLSGLPHVIATLAASYSNVSHKSNAFHFYSNTDPSPIKKMTVNHIYLLSRYHFFSIPYTSQILDNPKAISLS
jgi:hypothetical protein